MSIKLTAYSHGAGCGCKLSPATLREILSDAETRSFGSLLVGNEESDDAAVYQLNEDTSIISTTDFFMPIVDDPGDFGAIAATNALSDVYAMGGSPMMAIAILGWPIDKLSPEVAREVLNGARRVCHEVGIPLAGGHSIDSPEPIFGLAVTGQVRTADLKRNNSAREGDLLYLSKPLGIGLVTTAQKKGHATDEDLRIARESMLRVNELGAALSTLPYVHALTDVTGFGLAGHLIEVAKGSACTAEVSEELIPRFDFVPKYLELGMSPGGTHRNWDSYRQEVKLPGGSDHRLIADPQTSGGLLIAVDPGHQGAFEQSTAIAGYHLSPFGRMVSQQDQALTVLAH
ncbi:MAG: selenide, water dikinase SelD [Bacteroidota bacterium]